ncbi:MAG: PIN domain-containing protein [Proteobacteria bacterium]|nr:PIN domain-containing protein [Pseudomonadota bacterium]
MLPIGARTADRWGRLAGSKGRPLPALDGLPAATALHHDLTLVTRNTRDFEGLGVRLVNPWEG